jgi:hypothetical protein
VLYKSYVKLLPTDVALDTITVALENDINSVVAEEALVDTTSNKDKIH